MREKDSLRRNRIDVENLNSVPSYPLLYHDKYNWVGGFLEMLDVKKQIRELEHEKNSVVGILPPKTEFIRRLKKKYDDLVERQAANLRDFLTDQYTNVNPLQPLLPRLAGRDFKAPFLLPAWEKFQAAADEIKFDGDTISEADRLGRISDIDKKIGKLQSKLEKLMPDEFVLRYDNGHLEEDLRKTFVEFWKSLQLKVSQAISPIGIELSNSVEAEQKAWKQLRLDKCVSDFAPFLPYPGAGLLPYQLIPEIPAKEPERFLKTVKRAIGAR